MFEKIIHLLQSISCIWLALSVLYPVVNKKILLAVKRNDPAVYYRAIEPVTHPPALVQPALVTLVLTIIDILLSIL